MVIVGGEEGRVVVYCKVTGGRVIKYRGDVRLLKWVDCIACPIITCDGNDCSGTR